MTAWSRILIVVAALVLTGPAVAMGTGENTAETPPVATEGKFAAQLVSAARAQTATLTMYDPTYRKLDYPMGDVPWYLGVCTDVVVRAYRALGVDLQPLVHRSRVGSGDRNIDHRRVLVLKKFFARHGRTLQVSENPTDYAPGDIVTYHVPDGTFSKTHIAIVSDRKSWSGVPLVIHNRGLGVQEEDWLFESEITGHYRYEGKPNIEGWKG